MRGANLLSPPPIRLPGVWDPSVVLDYFNDLGENDELSLRDLTVKCVMLVALASAQRIQTLWLLDLQWLTVRFSYMFCGARETQTNCCYQTNTGPFFAINTEFTYMCLPVPFSLCDAHEGN